MVGGKTLESTVVGERCAGVNPVPMPTFDDLTPSLRFDARQGRIWLGEQRMALMHVGGLSVLRERMVSELGPVGAKRLFYGIGHTSGARDADFVRALRPDADTDTAFSVGPQMHMLEGFCRVLTEHLEIDVERGHFEGVFIWEDSIEDDVHLSLYGVSSEPACWMQLGYASGYTSAFVGFPVVFREVECRSMGHSRCRIVGRPADAWPDAEEEAGPAVVSKGILTSLEGDEDPSTGRGSLIGGSSGFLAAYHRLERVARASTSVLFLGETGVGKERFARMLHESGSRAQGPFVAVNCAAIPRDLIEAELFGVEQGAFTGADHSRPGRFERAQGGTLFLDELGTLSPNAQAKLLRALQEREVERVGGAAPMPIDVRLVAATNVDLYDEVQQGTFRADLYYRVAVFPIRIPPLRERRDDIPRLVSHFMQRFSKLHERQIEGLTGRAVNALLSYDYPGNIRELENMIERAVILCEDGEPIDRAHLFDRQDALDREMLSVDREGRLEPGGAPEKTELGSLIKGVLDAELSMAELESIVLEEAVERAGGNLSLAAKMVGLTRPQLAYRLKKRNSD